jgi:hypothetical protein
VRSVGKMADVEAWRSPWRLTDTKQRPHTPFEREPGPLARLAISTSLPDLTALAKQWARPRCLGLRESRVSSAPQRGDLVEGCLWMLCADTPGIASREDGPVARGPCRV